MELGGKNCLESQDLIVEPQLLVSGITLDYPTSGLGPWAYLGDHWFSLPMHMGTRWSPNTP